MTEESRDRTRWLKMTKAELVDELETLADASGSDVGINKSTSELLQEAIDTFADMVVLYNRDEKILFTNETYHQIYPHSPPKDEIVNYTQEQLLRRSLEMGLIDLPLAREDPEAWIKMRLDQRRNAHGGVSETCHANGRTYQVRHQRTSEGGAIVLQSDITDLKRAQALQMGRGRALEQLVEDAPLADVASTMLSAIEEARPGFSGAMYCFEGNDINQLHLHAGLSISDAIRDIPNDAWPFIDTINTNKPYTVENLSEDAAWGNFASDLEDAGIDAVRAVPICDAEGQVAGAICLFFRTPSQFEANDDDLLASAVQLIEIAIDRKQAVGRIRAANLELEDRVRERTASLRESEKKAHLMAEAADAAATAKSEFLASMSHEIRTPMTGVMGFADMLLDERLPAESVEKVKRIKESTHSLLTILNDILDISKLEAGKMVIEAVDFEPKEIVDELTTLFYQTCPKEKKDKLSIVYEVSDAFPEIVCGDPTRLRQILVNLIGNAVKFTDEGLIKITCTHDAKTKFLHFKVIDNGIGIGSSNIDKLFGDFIQADASVSRKYHGTGLGLSICKRLVELMDGTIGVDSELGSGSTFWFTLPYQDPTGHMAYERRYDAEPKNFTGSRSLSILVAEDNGLNQRIIRSILEGMGHEMIFAGNGEEAIGHVKETDFDLILMDVRMPVMSGPEATEVIRKLPGFKGMIPIIALTADVMAENRQSYLKAGMNDCVGKPIDRAELAGAINKAVGETVNMVRENHMPIAFTTYDMDEALKRLMLPRDVLLPILQKFVDEYSAVDTKLNALCADEAFPEAADLAHSIKGVAGSLGASELSELASTLERLLKNKEEGDLNKTLAAFSTELAGTIAGMSAGLTKLGV